MSSVMSKPLTQWMAAFTGDLRMDSRTIAPGDAFIAIKGLSQNGVDYIGSAIEKGAGTILVDSSDKNVALSYTKASCATDKVVEVIAIEQLYTLLPTLLNAYYNKANTIKNIGITGTNGKTTISQLIAQLAQPKSAVIGTLGAGKLDALQTINNTTPGIADNYRLLDGFANDGCAYAAVEVSSQGLSQGRVNGIEFGCVVFTNLTQDHLDYHGDLASYARAKKTLFEDNPLATTVLNLDDPTALSWLDQWRGSRKIIAVGAYQHAFINDSACQYVMFRDPEFTATGLKFTLLSSWGEAQVVSPLFGQFNLSNLVSAMAALLSYGVGLNELIDSVAQISAIPGRMEQFSGTVEGAVAVVDYAHTPDALAQALQALKHHTSGQLWCIFGCGGDRDKSKRPLMGQMAHRYADRVILTNDNPRNEPPEQIVIDIKAGLTMATDAQISVELDRKQAIASTLKQANTGDVILIAGKGHETYQIFGDQVIDYDERAYVSQCIREMSA